MSPAEMKSPCGGDMKEPTTRDFAYDGAKS